jgi:hypothetical protein
MMMKSCRDVGYHDWQVTSVLGTLPVQELELSCAACGAEATAEFLYEEDADG